MFISGLVTPEWSNRLKKLAGLLLLWALGVLVAGPGLNYKACMVLGLDGVLDLCLIK